MKKATPLVVRIVFGIALLTATTLPTSTALPDFTQLGIATTGDDCLPKYPPPPVLKIRVRVPACADPGQQIEYRICVENCSPAEAHHVVVKNALPSNAKYVKADPLPTKHGDEFQWQLGTIGGGAVREIILVLQPTNREDVKNCVRVQFEHGQCVVTRQAGYQPGAVQPGPMPPADGGPSKPPKIMPVPESKEPPELDLAIIGPTEQYVNMPAKYDITVTNKGKAKATGVLVSSRPPDKLKIVPKATTAGQFVEGEVAWYLGTLEPGASRRLELTLKATEQGKHCFKTTAQADGFGIKAWEACTNFHGMSAMTIEMYDTDDPVFIGHKTSYPVTIKNQGSAPLTNIRLRAFVPDALKFDRAVPLVEKSEIIKGGQLLDFRVFPKIDAGETARYEIFVEAVKAGNTRFQVEVWADQLDVGRPVIEQESTTIVDDRDQVQIRKLSRTK